MGKKELIEKANKLFNQGLDFLYQGKLDEAFKKWNTAKPIFQKFDMSEQIAGVEMNVGFVLVDLGKYMEAIRHFESAKQVFERLTMSGDVAQAEMGIATALNFLGKSAEAIKMLESVKSVFENLKMELHVANAEINIGGASFNMGRLGEAVNAYEAAKNIFKKLNIPDRIADAEMRIGNAFCGLGRPKEAIRHFESAKQVFERLNMQQNVAFVEMGIGSSVSILGKYEEAIRHFESAKQVFERLNMPYQVAEIEMRIGNGLFLSNRFTKGARHYEVARDIFKKLNMPHRIADVDIGIGNVLYILGKSAEAISHFESAKQVFERLNMPYQVAGVEMNIGNCLIALGKPAEAIRHFEIAKPIFEKLNFSEQVATTEMNIGIALVDWGKPNEAIKHFQAARNSFQKLNMSIKVANVELNVIKVLISLGKPAEAVKKSNNALVVYKDFGLLREQGKVYQNRGSSYALWGYLEQGKRAKKYFNYALRDLNRAFELMERLRSGVRSVELQRSLKEQYIIGLHALFDLHFTLWKRGESDWHLNEALNFVELAKCSTIAESLEAGGGGVPCPEAKQLVIKEDQLLKKAQQSYRKRVDLRKLRIGGEINGAQFRSSIEDLEKEYDVLEKEIENLRSEVLVKCADFGSTPVPRTYNILNRTLEVFPRNQKWGILELAISSSKDKLFVFLVNQDGSIQCEMQDIDSKELKELACRCQGIVEKVRNRKRTVANEELADLSKKLYTSLIPEKIRDALKRLEVEHLIIVPHKLLHWVPFEAIFDGHNFWGLKYALSTSFSLDLARLCVEKREKRALKLKEQPFFLLVKNPLLDLPGADKEVESVLSLLKYQRIQSKILDHEEATQLAFITAANECPFNILHYAGHAMFMGKHPSLSSLYLHTSDECLACSGKKKKHTPELLAAIEFIHKAKFKRAPIVYLSGCESGVAEVEAGDEMFGLVRALMYAGATSLVLSRWLVRDNVAPVFAEEFYSQLLGGESVAVALRNARQKVFNLDSKKFTDWAVFSLQGDPFRRLV